MEKLRHIAIAVPDLETAAKFYEETFGMERVRVSKVAIMLSDGVMSLAILHLPSNDNAPDERGADFLGLHHIGFYAGDMDATCSRVEENGGTFHGQIANVGGGPKSERKFRDPNGVVIDVVNADHVRDVWCIPEG
jgi:catechol 2,3-dioxygenase-like lactoylglutathione lyase family enzyme